MTWGNDEYGSDSSSVREQLGNVQAIQATMACDFTAILNEGSLVTWGFSLGGESCGES